jgi:hypothetical protein
MYAFHVAQAGDGGFVCAGGARCGIRVRSGVGANEIAGTEFVCNPTACFRCGAKTWPYRPMGPRAGSPGFHPGLVDLALQAGIADIGTQASGGCQSPVTARQTRRRVQCRMPVRATRWHLLSRTYVATGRDRPIDIDRSPELAPKKTFQFLAQLPPAQWPIRSNWPAARGDGNRKQWMRDWLGARCSSRSLVAVFQERCDEKCICVDVWCGSCSGGRWSSGPCR